MHVRMNRAFEFENENGQKVTAPRGWIGNLPDAAAKAAIDKGYAVDGTQQSATPVAEQPSVDGLDDKTRAELEGVAQERGVDVSAAKSKADVLKALRAA